MHGRDQVINYVAEKYGRDRVAQIITFGTMMARAAVRDAGRVLDIPYGTVDKIAKLIPKGPKVYLEECMKPGAELKKFYDEDETARKVVDSRDRSRASSARTPSTLRGSSSATARSPTTCRSSRRAPTRKSSPSSRWRSRVARPAEDGFLGLRTWM